MKQNVVLFIMILLVPFALLSQNVGIGTTTPSGKLHVKSLVYTDQTNHHFNEGVINPVHQTGTVDWAISSLDPYEGPFCAKVPFNIQSGQNANLKIPFTVDIGKKITIKFAAKNEDTNGDLVFKYQINGDLATIPVTPWKQYVITFVADNVDNVIEFIVVANSNSELAPIFLDDIQISYETGHPLKIEDGNQSQGFLMQSDQFGHATWVDYNTVVDDKIEDAHQNLNFDESAGELSISDGNSVTIPLIKGSSGDWKVMGDTLTGSADASILLPSSNGGNLIYNGEFGRLNIGENNLLNNSWSTSIGTGNSSTGLRTMTWGQNNSASDNRATSWGFGNESNSLGSTSWGWSNESSGYYSTVFGYDNTGSGSYSTTWGNSNNNLGSRSTVAGFGNINSGNYNTIFGDNNSCTTSENILLGWENEISTNYSLALGSNNHIQAVYAKAFGDNNIVDGENAIVLGGHNRAYSFYETAIGRYNYSDPAGSPNIWQNSNIIFSVGIGSNNSDRKNAMTIEKGGHVGIGLTNPTVDLHIQNVSDNTKVSIDAINEENAELNISGKFTDLIMEGDIDSEIKLDADEDASLYLNGEEKNKIHFGLSSVSRTIERNEVTGLSHIFGSIYIKTNSTSSNSVGIAHPDPIYNLHLLNDSAAKPGSSSWTVSSDSRLKKDVTPFTDGLTTLQAINPVWFTYNGVAGIPQETFVGTIAQELEKTAPYMVGSFVYNEENGSTTEYKDVNYGAMDFLLVNSIKELKAEIDELKQIVQLQSDVIDQLKIDSSKE